MKNSQLENAAKGLLDLFDIDHHGWVKQVKPNTPQRQVMNRLQALLHAVRQLDDTYRS